MTYNPFIRGEYPVGVRTIEITDEARNNKAFPLEVWYPAAEKHRGEDLEAATQDIYKIAQDLPERRQRAVRNAAVATGQSNKVPLVMYSHGDWGSRLDSTELCTHLASHGYVVAALDTIDNTAADLRRIVQVSESSEIGTGVESGIEDRPHDTILAIDRLLGGIDADLLPLIDPEQIGTTGCSLGGWTIIAINSFDHRIKAAFPIAPAWGNGPVPSHLLTAATRLDDWGREVAVFVLAQERDAMVMLGELRKLYESLAKPKRFAVLANSSHVYSIDQADIMHDLFLGMFQSGRMPGGDFIDYPAVSKAWGSSSSLCPAEHSLAAVKALCLAHMDEHLKTNSEACAFLNNDPESTFAARGIKVEITGAKERATGK